MLWMGAEALIEMETALEKSSHECHWKPFKRNMTDMLTGCCCTRSWDLAEQGAFYFEQEVVEGPNLHKSVLTSRGAGFILAVGETNPSL